jgi:hypothetical protein
MGVINPAQAPLAIQYSGLLRSRTVRSVCPSACLNALQQHRVGVILVSHCWCICAAAHRAGFI